MGTTHSGSISQKVLRAINKGYQVFENPYKSLYEAMNDPSLNSRTVRTAVDRMRRRGLLERVEEDDRDTFRLTEAGRRQIEVYEFPHKKWDGQWLLVSFDIPERFRKARNVLRGRLMELGFKQFQESLWIYPFDISEEIDRMRKEYGVTPYVKIVRAHLESGDSDRFKKKFQI
jgi:phenylacetic acid degradation operon negative regulatory protein